MGEQNGTAISKQALRQKKKKKETDFTSKGNSNVLA